MKLLRLAAAAAGLLAATALPVLAQSFGAEQRLYPHPAGVGTISRNSVIHAASNKVYLAWSTYSSATGQSEIWARVSLDNGTSFGAAVNVSNRPGEDIEPVLVGDGGSNVHAFWTDDVQDGSIFYSRSTNNGASWSAATALVAAPGYSRPSGALVNGSEVHLVYYDNSVDASVGKVYHKRSCNSGATWQASTDVTLFDGDVDNEQPRLVQSTTGEIFLSLRSSRGGVPQGGWPPYQIYLERMLATGCAGGVPSGVTTWARPAQLVSRGNNVDLGGNYAASMVTGSAGLLHALWWNDTAGTNLMYRSGRPNGNGFGPIQDLSGFGVNHPQWEHNTERLGYGFGEDAAGRLHAIFMQATSTAGIFQTGNLWYRCAPTTAGVFVAKQLLTGSLVGEPRAMYGNNRMHVAWQDYRFAGATDQSEIFYNYVDTNACTAPVVSPPPTPSTATVSFGGNSMQTTSSGQSFMLTNNGAGNLVISNISASSGFSVVSHNCGTVGPGGSCTVTVNFTPGAQGTVNGTASITYNGGTSTVNLTGVGERSLVTHYYRAILNRAPDGTGKAFWEGEAARLTSLSVDINETWYVMAGYFFNSAEYLSGNKNDTQFVTDLYNTFFNRAPDGGGLGYWVGQIQGGLPREVVLFSFMFSTEFQTFTQGIFGNTASRPEVNIVMDYFRGILNRLPDTSSFQYWLGRMRAAQCAGAGPVYTEVDQISSAFIFNPEYNSRNRNNTQFVTDMYYSFLRRGGDAGGVNFWINQLNTSQMSINTVRTNFLNSPEFGTRVQAVINAGCYTGP